MGFLSWIVRGLMAGAVIGGFVGTAFGYGTVSGLNAHSTIVAVPGSVVPLLGYRAVRNR